MNPDRKTRIKRAVRFFYDVQKLRVQAGNRASGQAEDSEIVLDESDVSFLRSQSEGLEALEKGALNEVKRLLKGVEIFEQFLDNQPGCGPTMSGVILSEIDITLCDTVSALWSYCGLAVVLAEEETESGERVITGRSQRLTKNQKAGFNPWLRSKLVKVLAENLLKAGGAKAFAARKRILIEQFGPDVFASQHYQKFVDETFSDLPESDRRNSKKEVAVKNEFLAAYIDYNEFQQPEVSGWTGFYDRYKHRKANQLVPRCMGCLGKGEITARAKGIKGGKKGEEGKTPGKPMPCPNCKGKKFDVPWGAGPAHRDRAAKRYMVKMFLLDLWKAWRTIEGLPVGETYAEQYLKMGHGDHGPDPEMERQRRERISERIKNPPPPRQRPPRLETPVVENRVDVEKVKKKRTTRSRNQPRA